MPYGKHRKPALTFEEFEHSHATGDTKRPRERNAAPTHTPSSSTVIVLCTCCNKQIDLRTIHCGDCCDDDRKRRRGDSSRRTPSHKPNGGNGSHHREDDRDPIPHTDRSTPYREERRSAGARDVGGDKRLGRLTQGVEGAPSRHTPLAFVAEGHARHHQNARGAECLGAEESLAQQVQYHRATTSIEASEADLVDLSIAAQTIVHR